MEALCDPARPPGLFAGRAVLARESLGPRRADRHLLWLILDGGYDGEIDGAAVRVRAGDLLWIGPDAPHRLVATGPVRKYFLRLDLPLPRPPGPAARRIGLEAETWCAALLAEQARSADADPRRIRALLVLLFTAWQRAGEAVAGGLPPERRARLIQAVHADPGRRWTRAGLGAAVGISGLHLSRQVRSTFRMPLRRWLVETRIRAAAHELAGTDESVTAIARRYGYPDVFLFSRQFRAVMGRSPRAWRMMA